MLSSILVYVALEVAEFGIRILKFEMSASGWRPPISKSFRIVFKISTRRISRSLKPNSEPNSVYTCAMTKNILTHEI